MGHFLAITFDGADDLEDTAVVRKDADGTVTDDDVEKALDESLR